MLALVFVYSLTGESDSHEKQVAALEQTTPRVSGAGGAEGGGAADVTIPLADCRNMVFMGTLACGGHAKAVVIATGDTTRSVVIIRLFIILYYFFNVLLRSISFRLCIFWTRRRYRPLLPGTCPHFYRPEGSAFPLLVDFHRIFQTHAPALSMAQGDSEECPFGSYQGVS